MEPVLGNFAIARDCAIHSPLLKRASTRLLAQGKLASGAPFCRVVVIVKLFVYYFSSLHNSCRSCRSCAIELGASSDGSRTWSVSRPSAGGGCLEHVDIYFLYFLYFCCASLWAISKVAKSCFHVGWTRTRNKVIKSEKSLSFVWRNCCLRWPITDT